jgi:predicted transcriptional regulator
MERTFVAIPIILKWDIPRRVYNRIVTKSIYLGPYDVLTEQLIAARKSAKMTQAEVAVKLQKPQSFVSKYENAERRLDVVEFLMVCRALDADAVNIVKHADEGL